MANLIKRVGAAWKLSGVLEKFSEQGLISRVLAMGSSTRELPEPTDFDRLADEGFKNNALVYACVRYIARSIAEPTLKALTIQPDGQLITNTVVEGDPLAKLIAQPNGFQDQYEFFEQLFIHLNVAGNAFIHKVRAGVGGPPVELELIRPDIVGIVPGKTRAEGKVKYYTVTIGTEKHRIDREDIIHIKLPDALDEYWGLSPLYVIMRHTDIDLQSADFLRSYFLNRGIPAGMLSFDRPVAKEERERVRDLWKEHFQGLEGWHNIAVLDANVEYQKLSSGIENVDLGGVTGQTETRICMVFGVPPVLIATHFALGRSTHSNMEESRRLFWVDTLSPMFARLSRKLTVELAVEFNPNRQVVFDLSTVSALQENKVELRKIALQGWNSSLLTRNMALSMLGLSSEAEGGDLIKVMPGTEFRTVLAEPQAEDIDDVVPTGSGSDPGV